LFGTLLGTRMVAMDNLCHALTRYSFAKDPEFHSELVSVVNHLVIEREEVANILSADPTTRAIHCIKECQSNLANPTPQSRRRMRAAWARLDKQEQFDLTKVARYQKCDDLRVKTLLTLAGVHILPKSRDIPSKGPLASDEHIQTLGHTANDAGREVHMDARGRKLMSL